MVCLLQAQFSNYMLFACREIEVLNDETAIKESEEMLVHVTCWRNMGSPPQLNPEQALQDVMNNA